MVLMILIGAGVYVEQAKGLVLQPRIKTSAPMI